jgi:phytoene desaturase
MKMKTSIIGAGFSGLAAAAILGKNGVDVEVFEKNDRIGGRARQLIMDGFTFDMGPSWYWMPDVIEKFFSLFDKKTSDYYRLIRLDPGYRIFFGKNDILDIPGNTKDLYNLFDSIEPGSGNLLKAYLRDAEYKYHFGMEEAIYKPSLNFTEFLEFRFIYYLLRLELFKSVSNVIRSKFKDIRLIRLLEFPVLFLGAKPQDTPALYSLMNYADLVLGSWYPMGGMYKLVDAMVRLAESYGVKFHVNTPVEKIIANKNHVAGIQVNGALIKSDYVIGSADYQHIEENLLPPDKRNYNKKYWNSRTMAPSALLIYLGINKKINGLLHHNIFFDTDFEKHASEIYSIPKWPENPALYISCTSKTDPDTAPEAGDNLVVLIPIAPGLPDYDQIRDKYFQYVLDKLEHMTGQSIRENIVVKKIFSVNDFVNDYNSFKGNAYGLANTLRQTAFLKPKMRNKKLPNLYYAGQLTTPGPGIPPTIVSGQVAALEILKSISLLHN